MGVSFRDVYSRQIVAMPKVSRYGRNIKSSGDHSGSMAVSEAMNIAEAEFLFLAIGLEPAIRSTGIHRETVPFGEKSVMILPFT